MLFFIGLRTTPLLSVILVERCFNQQTMVSPQKTMSHDFFPRIRPFLDQTIKTYGKNCYLWEGPIPIVNIAEAELVKQILSRHTEFKKPTGKLITARIVRGLVDYEGQEWALHRKLLNPAFHIAKFKLMQAVFYTSCNAMVNGWEERVLEAENEIDVFKSATKLSADVISRATFGSSYEQGERIFQLIKEQIIVAFNLYQSVYNRFPGMSFIPTKQSKKMNRIEREIKELLRGIIVKRKEEKEIIDDLLGILMESNSDNKKHIVRMTDDEIIDKCKLFYVAGQETTSSLLTWTIILLGVWLGGQTLQCWKRGSPWL